MRPLWQPTRQGFVWLLIVFIAVVVQHIPHLPLWVTGAALVVVIWRIQIYRGVWRYPNTAAKIALAGICIAGLYIAYGRVQGLEPMTALLVSAYCLKLLECHTRRDSLVVVYLAFLIAVLQALFQQEMATALYISFCIVLVLTSLMAIHQRVDVGFWLPFRRALVSVGQAIPVMIVLFMVMPRLGALWAVPTQKHGAKTGISDFMSPGDIANLGRSSEVAFRVSFDGAVPAPAQRYWRGLVFSSFDGRTWREEVRRYGARGLLQWPGEALQPWFEEIDWRGEQYSYRVIQEPTQQPWLFALETPRPQGREAALTRDLHLISRRPVSVRTSYQVRSWTEVRRDSALLIDRQRELQLPPNSNPETQQMALRWRAQVASDSDYIQRVLALFNREFIYTLQPPLLGQHAIDEFLWRSKQGFCEHFAGSFVFMMRAAGIPARVVVGYQGGEYQPQAGYLVVRQYDAHAWAEVWLEGRGWVRFDPTAAVAPERIEMGLAEMFGDDDIFASDALMSLEQFRGIPLMNLLRLKLDEMEYLWSVWVLGYEDQQADFLSGLLGAVSPLRIALFLVGTGGGIMVVLFLCNLRTPRGEKPDPAAALWLLFCRRMQRQGVTLSQGEAPGDFCRRIADLYPAQAGQLEKIASQFEGLLYNPGVSTDSQYISSLQRAVRSLKLSSQKNGEADDAV